MEVMEEWGIEDVVYFIEYFVQMFLFVRNEGVRKCQGLLLNLVYFVCVVYLIIVFEQYNFVEIVVVVWYRSLLFFLERCYVKDIEMANVFFYFFWEQFEFLFIEFFQCFDGVYSMSNFIEKMNLCGLYQQLQLIFFLEKGKLWIKVNVCNLLLFIIVFVLLAGIIFY